MDIKNLAVIIGIILIMGFIGTQYLTLVGSGYNDVNFYHSEDGGQSNMTFYAISARPFDSNCGNPSNTGCSDGRYDGVIYSGISNINVWLDGQQIAKNYPTNLTLNSPSMNGASFSITSPKTGYSFSSESIVAGFTTASGFYNRGFMSSTSKGALNRIDYAAASQSGIRYTNKTQLQIRFENLSAGQHTIRVSGIWNDYEYRYTQTPASYYQMEAKKSSIDGSNGVWADFTYTSNNTVVIPQPPEPDIIEWVSQMWAMIKSWLCQSVGVFC